MGSHCSQRRPLLASLAALLLSVAQIPTSIAAGDAMLLLRPHCEEQDQEKCPMYTIIDPTTLQTETLDVGDTLDVDVVVINPTSQAIQKARIWLSYDADVLEGSSIDISPDFPLVTPGEADFSASEGYAKMDAATDEGVSFSNVIVPIARVQFVVKTLPQGGESPISFYDVRSGLDGHTYVTTDTGTQNILQTTQGSLLVTTSSPAPTAASSAAASIANSVNSTTPLPVPVSSAPAAPAPVFPDPLPLPIAASSSSGMPLPLQTAASSLAAEPTGVAAASSSSPTNASFGLLQIQNVRASSQDTTLYISWDPLRSTQLKGYNVYYGTEAGTYMQRRQLSAAENTTSIVGLPDGMRYYVAVRAVSQGNEESAFSQEVAVEIGNPNGSTAPLATIPGTLNAPPNPVKGVQDVPGQSGAPSALLLLLSGSAAIGTLLAFRRQFTASATHHE